MHHKTIPLLVAALLMLTRASSASAGVSGSAEITFIGDDLKPISLQSFDLLSPDEGWVLLNQRLHWTDAGGSRWDDITPAVLDTQTIAAAAFLDARHGWLVLMERDETGFPAYALARTDDGGVSWETAPLDLFQPGEVDALAAAVYLHLFDAQTGWLAVKHATSSNFSVGMLFKTADGGDTWTRLSIPIGEPVYFVTPEVGWAAGGAAGDGLYRTEDGGATWTAQAVPPSSGEAWPEESGTGPRSIPPSLWAAGITELDMATPDVGWARYQAGNCAAGQCTLETRLLRTEDGGQTWTPLTLPGGAAASIVSLPAPPPAASTQSVSSRTQAVVGHGFDKCEVATLAQAQAWMGNSPYRAMNLYIGGSNRSCGNAALNATLVSQLGQQGWKFIPTWVGPQSMCWGHATSSRISNDPAVAYNQGVDEANAAVDVAANLGLTLADGTGSIIYYDLENYSTGDAACREAARAFISGWVSQVRARGNLAGVYSNGPPLSTFATIPNVPDAIWPASWYYSSGDPRGVYNPNATVWNVYSLSNDLWSSHQRIRQYTGGHTETWGGVALNIDCNVLDGIVATFGDDGDPPVTTHALAGTVGAGGWYITPVQVTLSASDGGSGVRLVQYHVDSGPWQTYGGPFSVSDDGNHTVYYQAQDNAGNWESEKQVAFKVDVHPPSNPTSVDPGCAAANNLWQNTCNDPAFTWSGASDGAGSGVQDYRCYWGELSNGQPVTYTTGNSFDPPAVPGSVAVRYLRLSTRDLVGHESQPATVFVLRYDASPPTVTVQINNGAASTNQVNVTLNLSTGDTGSGVAQVCVSNSTSCSNWQSYADGPLPSSGQVPWTLPALDRRALVVYVRVRDRAGNVSTVASDSITLDLYPPAPHSANYRICASVVDAAGSVGITSTSYALISAIGQPWATGAAANASSAFGERSGFLSSITGCLPITRPVTSNYTVTQWVVASGGNLRGSTSYRLGDTTGQPAASGGNAFTSTSYILSSGFWAQITGTVPPTPTIPSTPVPVTPTPIPTPGPTPTPQPGGFGVSINDGALYTNDPLVTVRVWAPNVTHMRLSNDGGYADDDWRTYQITSTWVLSIYGNQVRPYYIYAWFRDAGNSVYGSYYDDILYDPIPPEGQVSVLGGDMPTVTLWLEAWDEGSGVDQMRVGEEPAETGTVWLPYGGIPWQPYTNTITWVLQSDVVYVQFQDRAGNLSPIYGSDASTHWVDGHYIYLPLVLRSN